MTMAYVLVVQPSAMIGFGPEQSFTDINGLVVSRSAILIMTALISGLVTLVMALYANVPFALSTGMGTNFLFGALLGADEISFGGVMAITLISGSIFVVLSLFGVRDMIVRLIPANIKFSISVVIGFFIVYLGFDNSGLGDFSDGINLGNLSDPAVLLTIFGVLLIAVLRSYKVTGDLLIGIVVITLLSLPFGITNMPSSIVGVPEFSGLNEIMFSYDFSGLISGNTLVLIFITFFGDFFSTLGTVLGVAQKADLLDENGNYPEIHKPFIVDAIGTLTGSAFGCTTITTYVESSSGVEAGGKTGLTSLTTSVMFFLVYIGMIWKNADKREKLFFSSVLLFSIASFLANTLSGRAYAHYLISLVPIITIPLALLLRHLPSKTSKRKMTFLGLLFLPTINTADELNHYDQRILNNKNERASYYEVAEVISDYTSPEDNIYVHRRAGNLYLLSGRLSSMKYFNLPAVNLDENPAVGMDFLKEFKQSESELVVVSSGFYEETKTEAEQKFYDVVLNNYKLIYDDNGHLIYQIQN